MAFQHWSTAPHFAPEEGPPANIVGCLAHDTQAHTTETHLAVSFSHTVSEGQFTTAIEKEGLKLVRLVLSRTIDIK